MKILTWIAYSVWIIAALLMFLAFDADEYSLLPMAASLAISGVLFLAFDRVVTLLTEIRDAVRPATSTKTEELAEIEPPARSIDEIAADLDRLKVKQNS